MSVPGAIFEAPAAHGVRNPARRGWGGGRQGPSGQLLPLARALAPLAARVVANTLPSSGFADDHDPIADLLAEAEQETVADGPSGVGAIGPGGPAGLATANRMGVQASAAPDEVEAAAIVAGSLPITITVLGAGPALRPVLPILAQATSRLIGILGRHGPDGRALVGAVPAIHRKAVTLILAANRRGEPISGRLATAAMARATDSVLRDPELLRATLSTPGGPGCGCGCTQVGGRT